MLLYILWEVKRQVYRIWPHLKTSPTTFFCLILQVKGYLIISPNRTNKYCFQRICELSKSFPKRTHNEQRRTKTDRNAACKVSLNKIVRRTAAAKWTVNERRKQHIHGVWNTLFGCSAKLEIYPTLMLTLAPRCPVSLPVPAPRVVCRRRARRSKIGSQPWVQAPVTSSVTS